MSEKKEARSEQSSSSGASASRLPRSDSASDFASGQQKQSGGGANEPRPKESPKTERSPSEGGANEPRPKESPKAEAPEEGVQSTPEATPDWKSLYAITLADFDNYKKRAARDREDVYRYAESDILKDILPVVDNLSLALEHAANKDDEFVKGVRMVYEGLLKALADHGAKPMTELVGKELDPNFHEAIATLPDEKIEEGKISNVAKTGWTLNDKLLRAAQVVVSSGKPQTNG